MTIEDTGSIPVDELDDGGKGDEFDPIAAFMESSGSTEDDQEADPSAESDDQPKGEAEPSDAQEEDPEFDVKVGDETRKAKLSELRRLYGQEAALTQKSQIVAELRAKAEAEASRATLALTTQVERAQKAWEPYSKLDFLALSTRMQPDDFVALRAEAQAALSNVQFFTTELDGIQKATVERHAATSRERATATIAELSDPVKGIKGWGPELYGEVMRYAAAQGMPQAVAQSIVEAPALRMIHKAMLADRAATKAPAVATKVVAKPTVSLKPGAARADTGGDTFTAALKNQRTAGGSLDATASAFEAHARRS